MFTDDYSGMKFVEKLPSKNKIDVFNSLEKFITMAERQQDRKVKAFTLNHGSEFFNSLFIPFCDEKGILLHDTAPYTPAQNSVSERGNKTIINKARTMLIDANMPKRFWYPAIDTAVFLDNRTISKSSGEFKSTPHELWNGHKTGIKHLRTF